MLSKIVEWLLYPFCFGVGLSVASMIGFAFTLWTEDLAQGDIALKFMLTGFIISAVSYISAKMIGDVILTEKEEK